jgi:replicative DNA helicase
LSDIGEIRDIQSEAGVIASILQTPEFILRSDFLKPGHFSDKVNGAMYLAISQLYDKGIDNIDAFNLSCEINSDPKLRHIMSKYGADADEYVSKSHIIARSTPEEYLDLCRKVFSFSYRRELAGCASLIETSVFNDSLSTPDVKKIIDGKLTAIEERYLFGGEIKTFGSKVPELWERICAKRTDSGYGVPSKFPAFKQFFTYEPGELYIIKARMKQGKSAFLMNETIYQLANGIPVVYFDTEMSDELFLLRMLANASGVDMWKLKTGELSYDENLAREAALSWIAEAPLTHVNEPVISNELIRTTVQILKKKVGVEFVVFDYIKDNSPGGAAVVSNALGAKTDFLKNEIGTRFDIPVLSAVQLGRSSDSKGHVVADSDKIERYVTASVLWRNKTTDEIASDTVDCGNYLARVDLNRIGPQHADDEYIDFVFNGATMRIEQTKKQHEVKEEAY